MTQVLFWLLQPLLIISLSPLCIGVIRKLKAVSQYRSGASILQPYKNLWKLFHKDEVISSDASWIFRFAPYILFSITIVVASMIPFLTTSALFQDGSDFLLIIALFAIGTFFLALVGMDTGSAFGGAGASREMTIAALSEGGIIISFLTLTIVAQSGNLFTITRSVLNTPSFFLPAIAVSFIAFMIVFLAETSRYPFDNPSTHLELTMIHEAMILEYSGKRLALMEWTASNKFIIFVILGINLFFPWGLSESFTFLEVLSSFFFLTIKIVLLCGFVALLESKVAKYRFFRLPQLLFSSIVLGIIAVILAT